MRIRFFFSPYESWNFLWIFFFTSLRFKGVYWSQILCTTHLHRSEIFLSLNFPFFHPRCYGKRSVRWRMALDGSWIFLDSCSRFLIVSGTSLVEAYYSAVFIPSIKVSKSCTNFFIRYFVLLMLKWYFKFGDLSWNQMAINLHCYFHVQTFISCDKDRLLIL